ncbi:hypothetical protein ABW21_db0201673 [Orbilia brochopaga]|nr:hypothetical protein ABW21_db0201673 [Drechslerella brochopaga]
MASVAVAFPPSADLVTQKGIRAMEDLPMGNTESDRPSSDQSSASPKLSRSQMDARSPSSSSLSELDSDDSEAETERLNLSPQKPAGTNTVNSASYSTPKKSIGESTLTSPSRSPSPLSSPGQETPKSPDREMTLGAIEQLTPEGSIAGSPVISPARKRKRAESENLDDEDDDEDHNKGIMDISDLEEDSPKKKTTQDRKSQASEEDDEDDEDDDGEDDEEDGTGKKTKRPPAPANDRASDAEEDSAAEDDDESPRPSQRLLDKGKGKLLNVKPLSPRKLASSKAPEIDADEDADEARDTDAADSNQHPKEDDEADEMSRTKRAAADELATIEILFAQLRDKIVEERVGEIDKEIAMVQDGTHPELVLMSQAIETHKKEKIEKANILLNFQLETAEQERIANRSAIWSQYHQDIRETRDKSFSDANKLWWAIHRERRAADTSVSDYVYKIPKAVSTQINHRSRYNAEVSLLAGIAKNVGFPAVPTMAAATTDEVRADLEAMGLVPAQAPAPAPAPPIPAPSSSTSQQFLPGPSPPQPGPSRLPPMPAFGPHPPAGYSPRPPKPLAPPPPTASTAPQLANAFRPSPPPMNPETRRPRSPLSPLSQPAIAFVLPPKVAPASSSPRVSKVTKAKAAASKASISSYEAFAEVQVQPSKRVPIKLEQSPTISSLSFAPAAPSYVAQQPIDRRMQVGGASTYRAFGK